MESYAFMVVVNGDDVEKLAIEFQDEVDDLAIKKKIENSGSSAKLDFCVTPVECVRK